MGLKSVIKDQSFDNSGLLQSLFFFLFHFGPDRDRVENLKFFKFILLYMFGRMKFIFVNGVEFGLQQNLKMLIRVGCIVFDIGDWLIK